MARKDLTPIELLEKTHYKSIYFLTLKFQQKENGLQQKHYRYALQKGNRVEYQLQYLKTFFQDKIGNNLLEPLYKSGQLQKDCIDNNNTMSNFLSLMVKKGILERKDKRYRIPISFLNYLSKRSCKKEIDKWSNDMINPLGPVITPDLNLSQEKIMDGWLFGFPQFLFSEGIQKEQELDYSLFAQEDVELIKSKLVQIHKDVMEINKIKSKYCKGGISKMGLFVFSAIQPQLKEYYKAVDEYYLKLQQKLKNIKNGFRG